MILELKPNNYFKYTQKEREVYLEEMIKFYLSRYVDTDNPQTYYVSLNELLGFLESQKIKAVNEERYESAEIYKHICNVFGRILEEINRENDGM